MSKKRKHWRGLEITFAVVVCCRRLSLDVTPFTWRRWLFSFDQHWLLRDEGRKLHVYLGPLHLWTMRSCTQFAAELEFGHNPFWAERPKKPVPASTSPSPVPRPTGKADE